MAKLTNQSNYNPAAFGQYGSMYISSDTYARPPLGYVFHAITALEDAIISLKSDSDWVASSTAYHTKEVTVSATAASVFVDTTTDNHGVSVGDHIYKDASLVGIVVSINTAADGSEDLSMFEVDRLALLTATDVLSVRTKDKGHGESNFSSVTIPKGVTIYGSWFEIINNGTDKMIAYFAPISREEDAT